MIALRQILVATDFSEPSKVGVTYGRYLALAYDAALHIVHVIEDLPSYYGPEIGFVIADVERDLEAVVRRDLDSAISEAEREALDVRTVVTRGANVSHAITEYASTNEIDLIIVGTHGRGAVSRILMGSVADRVVRTAPCPVLTVRAHERDFVHATEAGDGDVVNVSEASANELSRSHP